MIKNIKNLLIIIFIFFLGILTERFEFDKKAASLIKNIYDSTSRSIYNLSSKDKIKVIIDQKNYQKILDSREQALKRMVEDAESIGANAIVNVRLTTSMVMQGCSEILAYGTAVIVK